MAQSEQNLSGSQRFMPPMSGMLLIVFMGIIGVIGSIGSALSGQWLPAAIFGALILYPIFTFGWVDVEPGRVSKVRLIGGRTVEAHEIQSIRLDFMKSKSTKWWYPVLVLNNQEEVTLTTLKSVSEQKTSEKAGLIQAALGGGQIS